MEVFPYMKVSKTISTKNNKIANIYPYIRSYTKLTVLIVTISISLLLGNCATETVTSDSYVAPNFSLAKMKKVMIGYFDVRTNVPYVNLNFREQLEYHLLTRKYEVLPLEKTAAAYKKKKIKSQRQLKINEIKDLAEKESFDALIQGVIYEMDRSILDEGNHIIVDLFIFTDEGKKVFVRYIYDGDRSLISGELINECITNLLNQFTKQS